VLAAHRRLIFVCFVRENRSLFCFLNFFRSRVGTVLQQYDGIIAGYTAAAPAKGNQKNKKNKKKIQVCVFLESLSRIQLLAYVLQFEIGDYAAAASRGSKDLIRFDVDGRRSAVKAKHPIFMSNQGRRKLEGETRTNRQRKVCVYILNNKGEHCSVLVKLSSNGENLVAGHVTWSSMNTMLRVYKTYDFPQGVIQFSSFPGNC
jgi:hypothetical protein